MPNDKNKTDRKAKPDGLSRKPEPEAAHREAKPNVSSRKSRMDVSPRKSKAGFSPRKPKPARLPKNTEKLPLWHRIPWKRFLEILIGLILALVICMGGYACVVVANAPKINTENILDILSESTIIYDADGNEIDTVYTETDRSNIKFEDLPDNLINAFVALEDKTFWEHHGFNFVRMVGAVAEAVMSGGSIGGTSTITQQLARNLFLKDTRFEHSIHRKIVEAYYALTMEKNLSKNEIFEIYVNTIDLGYHSSGVQAASQAYFSKDVRDLSLAQCAALAPLAQAPSAFALVRFVGNEEVSPESEDIIKRTSNGTFLVNESSTERRELCLDLMLEQGCISRAEYDEAKQVTLKDMLDPSYTTPTGESAYFVDYVIGEVIDDLMEKNGWDYETASDEVYNGGLRIYSTLDSQAQEVIEKEFDNEKNFPKIRTSVNRAGNITRQGRVVLYDYDNYFDAEKNFVLAPDEFIKQDDGSLTLLDGKRLNFYDTVVQGTTDYSVEFKNLYLYEDGRLNTISGGFINIPQPYKSRDGEGNIVISADFFKSKDYKDFFIFNEDGTLTIPSASYTLNQKIIQPQAAMTIIENSTGYIKAMVGGRKTTGRLLHNRATSPRQPGSSIKPLGVYSPAIAQSGEEAATGKKHTFKNFNIDKQGADLWGDYLTLSSIVIDETTHINGRDWPTNVGNSHAGPMTMRRALQLSVNTCAVKIFMQVGLDYSLDTIKRFGISTLEDSDLNAAALALGGMTRGVTTLDMASAYSVFPNNGTRMDTKSYTKVENSKGEEILSPVEGKSHDVLDAGTAWIMTDLLKSVIYGGIGSPAAISGVRAGGKTGTTDEQCDIWFDGFTPSYSASLWIGNDQNLALSEMSGPAAKLWGRIMNQIDGAKRGSYKKMPRNVIRFEGEYYISGTESGIIAIEDIEKELLICKLSGYLATPECPFTELKKFIAYGEEKQEAPEFYCPFHNSDPEHYPVNPEEFPPGQEPETEPLPGPGTWPNLPQPEKPKHEKPDPPFTWPWP